jgi:uroporphyrinogen decarboxylase
MIETAEKAGHDAIVNINGYWEVSPGEPAALWLREEKDRLNQIRALKKVSSGKHFIIGIAPATMGIPDGNHIYDFVIDLYENPNSVKERNEKLLLDAIELQNKLLDAGADGIVNPCDIAFNSGTFISPSLMDEFFFPYFKRWVENLKNQGILSIWHTDGNILSVIDRAIECGVSAIQCIDPLAGMDIVELKKKVFGKVALIGNIDCSVLQSGPKNEIEAQVKKVIEGCKGNGGFVLSACNAIFHGISADNYHVMVDGRYKYGME